jgi:hypothetical protein
MAVVHVEMGEVGREQARLRRATHAVTRLDEARLALAGAPVAMRDLLLAQTPEAVAASGERMKAALDRAEALLEDAAPETGRPATRDLIRGALPEIEALRAGQEEVRARRRALIEARDGRVLPLSGEYDQAFEAVASGV